MTVFVKSLKRLYKAGRLEAVKLAILMGEGKISNKEYAFIVE